MQALQGGGVAAPDHVRPASLALQPIAQADPKNQRSEPKSYKWAIIRLTTVSLMYLMMRTLWSMMTQLQLKIKLIIRKKLNKTLLHRDPYLLIQKYSLITRPI